jgi:protein TonB
MTAAKPSTTPSTARPALTMPADVAKPDAPAPATSPAVLEPWGDPAGSDAGVPEGMEGGVEGGMVGGVPGGVIGGVIGGTGDIPAPVMDYDQPPRVIRQVKPVYPQDAFVKKIEGTVLVEILIGADGRIARARVVRSVPQLDAAALAAVRQWVFAPGLKNGRPVATLAQAPITFRIY